MMLSFTWFLHADTLPIPPGLVRPCRPDSRLGGPPKRNLWLTGRGGGGSSVPNSTCTVIYVIGGLRLVAPNSLPPTNCSPSM